MKGNLCIFRRLQIVFKSLIVACSSIRRQEREWLKISIRSCFFFFLHRYQVSPVGRLISWLPWFIVKKWKCSILTCYIIFKRYPQLKLPKRNRIKFNLTITDLFPLAFQLCSWYPFNNYGRPISCIISMPMDIFQKSDKTINGHLSV